MYPENDWRNYLQHSTKGLHWTWDDHKYLYIKDGRYIYPEDVRKSKFGKYGKGNIDLTNRPVYKNEDGSISTVESFSTNIDGEEVLLPTIYRKKNGEAGKWTEAQAIANYKFTGEHLGKFKTPEEATKYAIELHNDQKRMYANNSGKYAVVSGGKHSRTDDWRDSLSKALNRNIATSAGPNVIYAPNKKK